MARPRPFLHAAAPRLTSVGALPLYDAQGRPHIRLQTLGAAVIMVGEVRLSAAAGTLFSLLVRLSGTPGMMLSRDVLRRTLWPEQEDVRQRANLRQALYKLRGSGVRVSMQGDVVILDEAQVVRSFSRERTAEAFERDVTLGHEPFGPFLPGFVVPWPEFQEWIDVQREAVHADVRRVLIEQLRRRRDRADWGGADALARWLLQFDPLNEEATLTIAECTALSGSKTEAVAILDRYLAELGPTAGDIRLPATMLRKRIVEPASRGRLSFAPTERHFVGREEELAALTMSMRRARWHDGSAVLLHGPPGIGKSRLVHELEKVALIEGVRVVQTPCRESDLLRPLSVFFDMLPELMNAPGALGCSPESLTALRRLVPSERGASESVEDPTAPRPPMPMASSLRRAIIDLLSAVSDEKPMLLVVEDVHWIDEHSWDVLADLIDRAGAMRVFLLLTSREPHARPHRPQRAPLGLRPHRVPPLSADHCLLLSRAIGEDLSAPISDELGEWFVRASEGIPLFLRALVNHWIETGEAGGVPPTLQGVIEQRLSQLSGDALRVLQTAALLGKWATTERVQEVLQHTVAAMIGLISALESDGMLAPSPSSAWRCHELVARGAIERLHHLTRASLNFRIARILEQEMEQTSNASLLLPTLRHLRSAGESSTLIRLCSMRIADLQECMQPIETLQILESIAVTQLSESDARLHRDTCSRLRVECGLYREELAARDGRFEFPLADGQMTAAEAESALSLADSAYRADSTTDRDQLADYVASVAQLPHLSEGVRLRAAGIGLVILSNQCDRRRAELLWSAIDIPLDVQAASVEAARVAVLYHTLFGFREVAARFAQRLLQRAMTDRRSLMAPVDAIRAGFSLRIVSADTGYIDAFEMAFDTAEAIHLPELSMNAAWQLAQSYLELGDFATYERWASELHRLHDADPSRLSTNFAPALFCRAAIERGDIDSAIRHLAQYVSVLPARPTIRASSHASALEVAIGLLADDWRPNPTQLQSLSSNAETVLQFGAADFLASVLIEGMSRVDRVGATTLLQRYLAELRRDCSPLSSRLERVVKKLWPWLPTN
ncbi:MAG: AAA family ATPase [Gemmatimonas sp.]